MATTDDVDVVATIVDLVDSRRVRLGGNFAGARFEGSVAPSRAAVA